MKKNKIEPEEYLKKFYTIYKKLGGIGVRVKKERLIFEKGFCPCCGNDFTKEHPIIGYEVSGLYDGILHWRCTNCNTYHYRFNKKPLRTKEYNKIIKEELNKKGIIR